MCGEPGIDVVEEERMRREGERVGVKRRDAGGGGGEREGGREAERESVCVGE